MTRPRSSCRAFSYRITRHCANNSIYRTCWTLIVRKQYSLRSVSAAMMTTLHTSKQNYLIMIESRRAHLSRNSIACNRDKRIKQLKCAQKRCKIGLCLEFINTSRYVTLLNICLVFMNFCRNFRHAYISITFHPSVSRFISQTTDTHIQTIACQEPIRKCIHL